MSQTPEQTIAELQQKIKSLELQLKKAKDSSGYGLKWEEKPEIFEERAQNALPLLKEDKSLLIDNKSDLDHIIIEWDNYHALSALSYTHKWMIDVIYIDPPYNTGNKDFIYNDNYVDPEDTYRHSKWLSFMSKRLKLAKNLLSDDGVIFMSIGDDEQANLKLLCDDIFWDKNFLVNMIINSAPAWTQSSTDFALQHSYCLVYRRSEDYTTNFTKLNEDELDQKYKDWEDSLWKYYTERIWKRWIWWRMEDVPSLHFPVYYDETNDKIFIDEEANGLDKTNLVKIIPYQTVWVLWRWTRSKKKMRENRDHLIVQKVSWERKLYKKVYSTEDAGKKPYSIVWSKLWRTELWSLELKNIMWDKVFDYPKFSWFISYLISLHEDEWATILDFFAGSWTTGHAVLDLNKQDWWHRQFILCSNRENTKENPDKNICKDITYERVKRVMEWYTNLKWERVEWLWWWNLRYYTTEFIEKKKSTDDLRQSFIYLCDELLCIKEDTFNEYKSELLSDKLKCYQKNNHYTVILYDIREIGKLQQLLSTLNGKISVYIFSLSKDSCEEELQEFSDKITIENIPDDILETYKKIF